MMRPTPTRLTWRLLVAVAALLALAILVAAGCGSSSKKASPTSSSSGKTFDVNNVTTDSALTALLPSNVTSAGQIRCASDIPYPPWEMWVTPTSKQPTGIDYDLSQAIGKKLGIKVSFNDVPFDSIPFGIQSGKYDIVMSDMYDTAARQKYSSFVDYAADGTAILVATGNPDGITTPDSLAGKTVACESGTTQETFLQTLNTKFKTAGQPQMTILVLQKQPEALLAIQGGKAAADLTDASTAGYIATHQSANFEIVKDPAAPNGYEPQLVGIEIAKANTQLVDAVQKALQALINDGSYQLIVNKYGFLPVKSAQVNQGPSFASTSSGTSASPTP
jgi:polar amino acid transport system substrate-binding protein